MIDTLGHKCQRVEADMLINAILTRPKYSPMKQVKLGQRRQNSNEGKARYRQLRQRMDAG